ncbi:MAG: ATP-binding protein [Prevotellaceae bacterium]|jgi:hypothetical protein|nr:ATP-binding protein [Prevotellaceae bacterium]
MENIAKISAESCRQMNVQHVASLHNIIGNCDTLDEKHLYLSYFGRVPNWIDLDGINGKKANEWLSQTYKNEITDCSYVKRYEKRKGLYFDDVYYFLFDDLLVYITTNDDKAKLLFKKTDIAIVEKIANEIRKFKPIKSRTRPEIKLLINTHSGLDTKEMDISKPKLSIEDNYNDDFLPIHKTILSRLQKKNDKGLVLLHGKPGTGKTSYLRYLIAQTKKDVIFLPPNMAASITDPGLMGVLIDNPNSVFVIEDAENIVIDRNRSGSSSVSALLNLADGLLSDCLNIQIICSFNTDLSRVDSALMRKGRLIAKYEFNELERNKAQALSDKLGFDTVITEPMTLAQIYNQNEAEFAPVTNRRPIGFQIAV